MQIHKGSLTFQLRPSTQYHRLGNGKTVLVLRYPLRAIFIHPCWHPVLSRLDHTRWVSLEHITAAAPHLISDQIEDFLQTLTQKGYVAQKGFIRLMDEEYPSVSVIVPVRNRPAEIAACLRSLNALDYPKDKLQIIAVDDASEDETPETIAKFTNVSLLRMQRHRQASFCRNRAAEIARGDILAFIDSDCMADPAWLRELVPAFRDRSLGALGGLVDAANENNGLDRYEKVKSALKIGGWFKRSDQAERFFYLPTCNFLVRRSVFLRLGGLREYLHVGEDVDFCWRLQDAGHEMEYRPIGRVAHKHRNRLGAFCSRRFDYGTSEPLLQRLHSARVKTLYLPWSESIFWLMFTLSVVLKSGLLLLASAGWLMADGIKKHIKLRKRQVPATRRLVVLAILRGYLAFVYHCCSFISRYYLVMVPVAVGWLPLVAFIVMAMHLVAGMVEYVVKKPLLNPFSFLFFFTLEQVSYQCGVWWACIKGLNFRPVLPRIVHKRIG
ncbi:MAG: mycofactocin biosynthesis glycosyltransferase MftF [Desulfosarcinaceae bacterium]|nr:mycofactocin biosynthesis glycosyltransferase MftF [Desulfosarcinaceae bacterium]